MTCVHACATFWSFSHFLKRLEAKRRAEAKRWGTYPWKDALKKEGFEFDGITKLWLAPIDTDTSELEAKFKEYGFPVEYYDGVADEDEDA